MGEVRGGAGRGAAAETAKPVKVVAFLYHYPPTRLLGAELMTSLLLEALAARGHEVIVVGGAEKQERLRNGVRIIPKSKTLLMKELEDADVFISHPEIAAMFRNRVPQAKFVIIVHNLEQESIDGIKAGRPHLLVSNADATHKAVAHLARNHLVLHPPSPQQERLAKPPGLDPSFITFVNLSKEKGGALLWELAARRPKVPFLGVLGGHGEQISHVEPAPDNVWIMGQTPSMGLVYGMSKAVFFPTTSETYGMVGAEAAVCGVPVFASPLPGIKEALGDAGVYLDPTDLEAWVKAVDRVTSSATLETLTMRARNRGQFLVKRSNKDLSRFIEAVEQLAATRRTSAAR